MSFTGIGDLSRSFVLRNQSAQAKAQVALHTQELTTGVKADQGKAVGHEFARIASVQRGIDLVASYRLSTQDAATFTAGGQAALGVVNDALGALSQMALTASGSGTSALSNATSIDARTQFGAMVQSLNANVSGRFVFSGQATSTAPLDTPEAILTVLTPLAQAATTAADWQATLDTWFDTGGGFDTVAYKGGDRAHSGFLVSDGLKVEMGVKADRAEMRDALKAAASLALLDKTGFSNNADEMRIALARGGSDALQERTNITLVQAEMGVAEAAIARADDTLVRQDAALKVTRSNLLAADPYEAATKLEEAGQQLEALYLLTSRLSRLSLTEYLR